MSGDRNVSMHALLSMLSISGYDPYFFPLILFLPSSFFSLSLHLPLFFLLPPSLLFLFPFPSPSSLPFSSLPPLLLLPLATYVMIEASARNRWLDFSSLKSLSILMATFAPWYSPSHTSAGWEINNNALKTAKFKSSNYINFQSINCM